MEVEDMFSCPVCLERMEQPKMLQCQHTFCSECLKKMVKDTRILIICCPECRAIHKLDHRGVEGLPNNLTMMKFLHGPTQKKYNVEALCQDCKKKNIQAECCHCDKILCDCCLVKHTRILSDELRRSVSEAEALLPAMNSQIPENENESERVKRNAKTVRSEIQRWRKNCSEKLESTTKKILGEVEDFEKKGTGLFKELKEKHASIQSLSKIAAMKTEEASQMQGADGPIRQMQNEIIGLTKQCKSHASSAANLVRDIKARPKQSLKFCSDESQSIVDSLSGFGGLDVSVQGYQNGSNSPNVRGQENKIAVDKDIFQFLQLVKAPALDRIWYTNGAKILVSTIGDCSNIEVVSKRSSRPSWPFQPSTAIDQFQNIYSQMNDTACQEMYDLGTLREKPTDKKVEEVIRLTRSVFKDIYITRMFEDRNQVLFIAEKRDRCDEAMKLFARVVGGGQ